MLIISTLKYSTKYFNGFHIDYVDPQQLFINLIHYERKGPIVGLYIYQNE